MVDFGMTLKNFTDTAQLYTSTTGSKIGSDKICDQRIRNWSETPFLRCFNQYRKNL